MKISCIMIYIIDAVAAQSNAEKLQEDIAKN